MIHKNSVQKARAQNEPATVLENMMGDILLLLE